MVANPLTRPMSERGFEPRERAPKARMLPSYITRSLKLLPMEAPSALKIVVIAYYNPCVVMMTKLTTQPNEWWEGNRRAVHPTEIYSTRIIRTVALR